MPDVPVSIGHPADGGLPKRVADTTEAIGRVLLPALVRLRFEMAVVARENLTATQRLWSLIEHEVPDIRMRVPGYDRMKTAESELHVRYADHIAAWPVAAIHADFRRFAFTKRRFLDDLCRHARSLEVDFLMPACRLTHGNACRDAGQA